MAKGTKLSSNGGKEAACVRCQASIQPYAGVAANTHSTKFSHHPGQCADVHERESGLRAKAQANGFVWSCRQLELGEWNAAPVICDASGSDRAAYTGHMKVHGATAPSGAVLIRLRKRPPAAKMPALEVSPFKFLTWTERRYGEWQPGIGNPLEHEVQRRGQFWSEGPYPHSVWVLPLEPAPWESTSRPAAPAVLHVIAPGRYTTDWSEAKRERRELKRRAGYRTAD